MLWTKLFVASHSSEDGMPTTKWTECPAAAVFRMVSGFVDGRPVRSTNIFRKRKLLYELELLEHRGLVRVRANFWDHLNKLGSESFRFGK